MSQSLLSARERAVWIVCFLIVAALLILTRFTSTDPDSALYAAISTKLSAQPIARWIAPEWWGLWPEAHQTGYFREHPAGLFVVPAALGRAGLPPEQASFVFGVGAALAALLLLSFLVARITGREEGRAALVLLQLMPVAFVFRIRDNHEYPMLVCLLTTLIGLDGVSRSWIWMTCVALGLAAGLLIKGVFVVLVLVAAALWVSLDPARIGSRTRQVVACSAALLVMAAAAWAYDATYLNVTGETFWRAYWNRQVGSMQYESLAQQVLGFIRHLGFYAIRLVFHPAPWSLVLAWALWKRTEPGTNGPTGSSSAERRALTFVLAFTAISVLLLSAASRFAERYAFSATYLIGAAGVVIAYRRFPSLRQTLRRFEAALPAAPAFLWLALIVLRLVLGPFLPRIGG